MSIKELRSITKLSQREFSNLYKIPLKTIQNWEASSNSTSYRECPNYVFALLKRAVLNDYQEAYINDAVDSLLIKNDLKVNVVYNKSLKYAYKQILNSKLYNYIEDIVVYGSLTRNEIKESSDIDILLILNDNFKKVKDFNSIITKLKGSVSSDNYLDPEVDLHIAYDKAFNDANNVYYLNVKKDGISLWN